MMLVLAENQRGIAVALQAAGAALSLKTAEIAVSKFVPVISYFSRSENLAAMFVKAATLCDGKGAARVVSHLS